MRPTLRHPAPSAAVLRAAATPVIESLESRQLLSSSFDNGLVNVVMTNGDDEIRVHVYYEPAGDGTDVPIAMMEVNGHYKTYRGVTGIRIDGRGGDDRIFVNSRNVPPGMEAVSTTLLGGDGDDDIRADLTNDLIIGGAGDDLLYDGGAGHDSMFGNAGADVLHTGHPDQRNVYLCSGPGNDRVTAGDEHRVYDHLESGDGRDTNDDPADGLSPSDRFRVRLLANGTLLVVGSQSDDHILIQPDLETLNVAFRSSAVHQITSFAITRDVRRILVITGGGDDRVEVFARDLPAGIPVYVDSGDGDDTILTAGGDDTIVSGAGHDVVDAGAGDNVTDLDADDTAWDSAGAVHLEGWTIVVEGTPFADEIRGFRQTDTSVEFWVNNTRYEFPAGQVQAMRIDTGDGDDFVRADEWQYPFHLDTTMNGGAGDDWLVAGVGNETLDGGDGDDDLVANLYGSQATLIGGLGDDDIGGGAQQYGGAGDNLIRGANPYNAPYYAIPGTDGTGGVEPTGPTLMQLPPEYNPRVYEAEVLDPLIPPDEVWIGDVSTLFWHTGLCTLSNLIPGQTQVAPAASATSGAIGYVSVSVGPLAGVGDAPPAPPEMPVAAAAPADADGPAAAYALPPSLVSPTPSSPTPGPWADDPITDPWDDVAAGS